MLPVLLGWYKVSPGPCSILDCWEISQLIPCIAGHAYMRNLIPFSLLRLKAGSHFSKAYVFVLNKVDLRDKTW